MHIKVEKVHQVEKLFEVIDSCSTNVVLITGEGDCLNMKSKLSQYLSMTRMFANGDVPQMEFVTNDEQDAKMLIEFLKEDASQGIHKTAEENSVTVNTKNAGSNA